MNSMWKERMHAQRVQKHALKRRTVVAAKRRAAANAQRRYDAWRKRRFTNIQAQMQGRGWLI